MSDLSDFALRTKEAVDALELKTDAPTPGVHRVSVRDGDDTIARLTAEVVARVRYLPRAEDDGDRTFVALDWKVLSSYQMEYSTEQTLGANMHATTTVNTEAMCFVRALGALKGVLRKKMPELGRVVMCSAIVGCFTNDVRGVFKDVGFSVERREFGPDERHLTVPVYNATMELVLRTTGAAAAASAPPGKKRSRNSDEKDKTEKKKKKKQKHQSKAKSAKLAN